MTKKIQISADKYPSDKSLYDLIVSQKFAKTKLQKFLKKRGTICTSDSIKVLAETICGKILDEADFDEIVSFLSTRENRSKTTPYQFPSSATLDEIARTLNGFDLMPARDDARVKIDDSKLSISVDKDREEIFFEKSFFKWDFSKNEFLQKEVHEFSYRLKKVADGQYEISVKSSCPEAEEYVRQINGRLRSIKADEDYIHEVLLTELKENELNDFFDLLLKATQHGFTFESAVSVKMQSASAALSSESEEDPDIAPSLEAITEESEDGEERVEGSPLMKSFSVSGTNILEHGDVKAFRLKGFSVRSALGIFSKKLSASKTLKVTMVVEFNTYRKFQSEIKKAWLVLHDEENKEERHPLSSGEKEAYLTEVNRAAFEVFDSVKARRSKAEATAQIS